MAEKVDSRCPVCSGGTVGSKVCNACSTFFKRNKQKDFNCRTGAFDCELTQENRNTCKACRLKKCRAAGMGDEKENSASLKRNSDTNREEGEVKRRSLLDLRRLADNQEEAAGNREQKSPEHEARVQHIAAELRGIANVIAQPVAPAPQHLPPAAPQPDVSTAYLRSMEILGRVLPPNQFYSGILDNNRSRPDLFTFALRSAEDYHIKWAAHMFTCNPGLRALNNENKTKLYRRAFFLIYVVDVAWAIRDRQIRASYSLDNNKRATMLEVVAFGNDAAIRAFSLLIDQMETVGFTKTDYCFFRQLSLYDPVLMFKVFEYGNNHIATLNAWKDVRGLTKVEIKYLMRLFKVCLIIANETHDYLKQKFDQNPSTNRLSPAIYSTIQARNQSTRTNS